MKQSPMAERQPELLSFHEILAVEQKTLILISLLSYKLLNFMGVNK